MPICVHVPELPGEVFRLIRYPIAELHPVRQIEWKWIMSSFPTHVPELQLSLLVLSDTCLRPSARLFECLDLTPPLF
ncbi:hypothetical protein SNOG_01071 [Parastagonospora nodorum SN15]|uniref:Uncharacterized protein n=1 Tax=Phaeosphaeria nodorum (strain SN15 / ATCC MYA-4574 / FGSC 10173) TaxID=321614 RepID=Q0V4J3_PHANO|nr:hypothetical protein SNOG_01071 [Parastagonospora nodorum SN15]EAT92566.1 hypothetical protein SNOG_01071 [Parastagonospora nodorum SN15]